MTALLLQNLKLIMLFLLIGSVIGLSHVSGENRNGSDLLTRRMDSLAKAHKILIVGVRPAATADRPGFVPDYGVGPRQRSPKPSFG
ncbi:MAG: hypothetical protein WCF66_10580 [Pseudolabrys sp.]